MAKVQHGFVFRLFDKVVCALAVLVLLAGVVVAMQRSRSLPAGVDLAEVQTVLSDLDERMESSPPAVDAPNVGPRVARYYQVPDPPGPVRDPSLAPLPAVYSVRQIGPSLDIELEFNAPLSPGSVKVEGDTHLLQIVAHPVGDDYAKVLARTNRWEGETTIVGMSGDVKHILPVAVNRDVGKTPYAPVDLAVDEQINGVVLAFRPHPGVEADGVQVSSYEVWRRDWTDPVGEYELVGSAGAAAGKPEKAEPAEAAPAPRAQPTAPAARPSAPAPRRGGYGPQFDISQFLPPDIAAIRQRAVGGRQTPQGPRAVREPRQRATQPAKPAKPKPAREPGTIIWRDRKAVPGHRYAYRLRMVGRNTYPIKGEFTDPIAVEVFPSADFRFTLAGTDSVRFEIVKETKPGNADRVSTWVALGDTIGLLRQGGGPSFLTGCTLVDFHRLTTDPSTNLRSSRIIYADQDGLLHERYLNKTQSEELWQAARG
jgi:hypothetical protein